MRAITRGAKGAGTRNTGRNRWSSAGARYEVLDRVGEGTVFVVYRVRDKTNNRVLALKALKGGFNKHPRFAGALTVCAQRAQKFSHPNLARVDDVGEEDGTLFLVTEWLPGQSLEARLARAPFGRAEALAATRQIAEALNYLHQNGAVHGDVRPRQVGAAADGTYKLTDGGFYEAFSASGLAPTDVMSDAAWYQAPERSDGALPSPGSDLYSLGVVLYRMLAGRVPFDGPSPLSIAMRHRKDAPLLPSQFNPECPPDLQAVALRLLEKDPQTRYTSAGQLLRDLAVGAARPASVSASTQNAAPINAVPNVVPNIAANTSTQTIPVPDTAISATPANASAASIGSSTATPRMSTHATATPPVLPAAAALAATAAVAPIAAAATATASAATAAAATSAAATAAAATAAASRTIAGAIAAPATTPDSPTPTATSGVVIPANGATSARANTATALPIGTAAVASASGAPSTVAATPSVYSMPSATQPLPVANANSRAATSGVVAPTVVAPTTPAPNAVAPNAVAPASVAVALGDDEGDDDSMSADDAKRLAAQQARDEEKRARKKQRRREALGAFLSVFWLLVALGLLGGIFFGAYYFWQKETPRAVPVPAYVGRNEETARAMLQKYGLKMVVVSQIYDLKKPAGTVVGGEPQPGKMVRTGREVGVTVSRGAEQVNMPDLSELGLQRAREIIERSGMRLGEVADQYHDTVPKGYVCGQYPQPGQPFRRSDPINLLVSRGPQPNQNSDPAQLPPPPPRPDDSSAGPAIGLQPREAPSVALVSRTVHVRVAIAADGPSQEVRVVVRDNDGEHTVYQKTHAPGDLVDEDVLVTRPQGTTALVTIFVDGEQRGQQRV